MIICTLKSYMEKEQITQSHLSEITGITRPTLLQLIRNENQNIKYETVEKICEYFNIQLQELLVYSPIDIQFQKIVIEDSQQITRYEPEREQRIGVHKYKVKKGDSLKSIAGQFGIKVQDLITWNGLVTDKIFINQVLRINLKLYNLSVVFKIDGYSVKYITNLLVNKLGHFLVDDQNLQLNGVAERYYYDRLVNNGYSNHFFNAYCNNTDFKQKIMDNLEKQGLFNDINIGNIITFLTPDERLSIEEINDEIELLAVNDQKELLIKIMHRLINIK